MEPYVALARQHGFGKYLWASMTLGSNLDLLEKPWYAAYCDAVASSNWERAIEILMNNPSDVTVLMTDYTFGRSGFLLYCKNDYEVRLVNKIFDVLYEAISLQLCVDD